MLDAVHEQLRERRYALTFSSSSEQHQGSSQLQEVCEGKDKKIVRSARGAGRRKAFGGRTGLESQVEERRRASRRVLFKRSLQVYRRERKRLALMLGRFGNGLSACGYGKERR